MTSKADIVGALGARRCACGEVLGEDNLRTCDECVPTPHQILHEVIWSVSGGMRPRPTGPGKVIASLPPEKRRTLMELRAADVNGMRQDYYALFASK